MKIANNSLIQTHIFGPDSTVGSSKSFEDSRLIKSKTPESDSIRPDLFQNGTPIRTPNGWLGGPDRPPSGVYTPAVPGIWSVSKINGKYYWNWRRCSNQEWLSNKLFKILHKLFFNWHIGKMNINDLNFSPLNFR